MRCQLRRRKIDTLILSGVATSNGVYATALDAFQHGYHVIVIEDGCSDRDLKTSYALFLKKCFQKQHECVQPKKSFKQSKKPDKGTKHALFFIYIAGFPWENKRNRQIGIIRMKKKKITIKDVAKHSGVSICHCFIDFKW